MYLMYVDESGDPGSSKYGSPHFILCGLIVSELDWAQCLDKLKKFRQHLRNKYGLSLRAELHATELIRPGTIQEYKKIRKSDRVQILKEWISDMPVIFDTAKVISVCFDKTNFNENQDLHELAWSRMIQRYDTFLKKVGNQKGIILSDDTNEPLVRFILRRMRLYNPTKSFYDPKGYYQPLIAQILEDPIMRRSNYSLFVQAADAIAHTLYRKEYPKGSLKKFGLHLLFDRLQPILLKEASKKDKLGIVRK